MGAMQASDWFPLITISVLMIIGAVIDGIKLKVPNKLTYPMILSGWAFWATQGWGSFQASLAGAFMAGALVMIPYVIGGMGAGDVKMYAGFGAWIVPLSWMGYEKLFWAWAISVIVGGVMGVFIIIRHRSFKRNIENLKEMASDFQTSGSLYEVAEKATARKPRLQLLPYGIPLTIGSLGYLIYLVQSNLSA